MTVGLTWNINQDMNLLSVALTGLITHTEHDLQLQIIAAWITWLIATLTFFVWVAFNAHIVCFCGLRWQPGLKMFHMLIGQFVCHHIGLRFCWVFSVSIEYIYIFQQHEEPRHEMSVPLRVLQRNVDSPLNHSTSPSSPCYSRTFRGSPPYR
jgi:hypothetical protein